MKHEAHTNTYNIQLSESRNSVPVPGKDMQVNTLWGNQRGLI